jgi:hypothetical protein
MKMVGLVEAGNPSQARSLRFQALFDFGIIFNLHQVGRHISSCDVGVWMGSFQKQMNAAPGLGTHCHPASSSNLSSPR